MDILDCMPPCSRTNLYWMSDLDRDCTKTYVSCFRFAMLEAYIISSKNRILNFSYHSARASVEEGLEGGCDYHFPAESLLQIPYLVPRFNDPIPFPVRGQILLFPVKKGEIQAAIKTLAHSGGHRNKISCQVFGIFIQQT